MGSVEEDRSLSRWVAVLPANRLNRAGPLRLAPGMEVATDRDSGRSWLATDTLSDEFLSLPFEKLYRLDPSSGRLFPPASALPEGRLPQALEWIPLSEAIGPEPVTPLPLGKKPRNLARVALRRDGKVAPDAALLLRVSLEKWLAFAETAPEVRLSRLSFAASPDRVLIRGNPPPPIPGESWVEDRGIAVPAGFRLEPPVAPEVIRLHLGVAPDETVLFHPDGTIDRIAAENFVPATRASVRLTAGK